MTMFLRHALIVTLVVAGIALETHARSDRGFHLIPQERQLTSPVFNGRDAHLAPEDRPAKPRVTMDADWLAGELEAGNDDLWIVLEEESPTALRYMANGEADFAEFLQADDTPWVRVHFADYNLGEESYLIITSNKDGDWQRLDTKSMREWQNTSAIFNGDAVHIALFVAPYDENVYFEVDHLLAADPEDFAFGYIPEIDGGVASLCGGTDNRTSSSDGRVGRLFFGGCTGWLAHNRSALAAGHCTNANGNMTGVLEFSVPQSTSNGTPVAASVNNQFPITSTVGFQDNGEGQDWVVFTVGFNANTGADPFVQQGFLNMVGAAPAEGTTLRVTGYGLDGTPAGSGGPGAPCCDWDADDSCNFSCNSNSLTQQTSTGSCDDCLQGTAIEHTVDTTPANSGSPIIWNSQGLAFAIHAQGGCNSFFSDYDNAGTWLEHNPLENALESIFGSARVWVNAAVSQSLTQPAEWGDVLDPAQAMPLGVSLVPDNGVINIVAGNYTAANGNTFTAGNDGKAMTLLAISGTVTIGN